MALAAHPLCAYDAARPGRALAARAAGPDLAAVACFDPQFAAAVAAEGFALLF